MNAKNLKRADEWKSQDILFCIAQDYANQRLWVGSSDFKIYEVLMSDGKVQRVEFQGQHQSYVTGLVRIGQTLVTSSYDRHLNWWDIVERKLIRSQPAHEAWIRRVIASADGTRVISIADDMQCKVWEAESGRLLATFSDHQKLTPHHFPSMLYAVAASPDGKWLATGDKVGHVAVWDAERFEKVGEIETPVMYTWDPKLDCTVLVASGVSLFHPTASDWQWEALAKSATSITWRDRHDWRFSSVPADSANWNWKTKTRRV